MGSPQEALAIEERATRAFEASGDRRMEGVSRVYLAMIHLGLGEPPKAREEARRAVDLLQMARPAKACALATLSVAELSLASEDGERKGETLARADAQSAEALAIVDDLGGIEEGEALVRLMRAEVLLTLGLADDARSLVDASKARLLSRAERLSDSTWRASFLERVPENRRTFELHARLSIETPPAR